MLFILPKSFKVQLLTCNRSVIIDYLLHSLDQPPFISGIVQVPGIPLIFDWMSVNFRFLCVGILNVNPDS